MTAQNTRTFAEKTGRRRRRFVSIGVGALLLFASLFVAPVQRAQAGGDLLVAPTRLVFEGRERTAEVTLVNKGTTTEVFRVSLVNRRMRENGTFEEIGEPIPGERFVGPMVRYAPRRVTLRPNAPQTIRVQLRKPANLEEGEYRSHLMFRAVPDIQSAETTQASAGGSNFQVNLIPVYGVTIPVIVRHGELDAEVAVEGAEWIKTTSEAAPPALTVHMTRLGKRSVYGTVKIMAAVGDETYAKVRGVAIYTPNRRRSLRVPIDPDLAETIKGTPVRIAFFASENDGGALLAEQRVTLR